MKFNNVKRFLYLFFSFMPLFSYGYLTDTLDPLPLDRLEGLVAIVPGTPPKYVMLSELIRSVWLGTNGKCKITSGKLSEGCSETDVYQILDNLINQQIILVHANKEGIIISDEELDQHIEHFLINQNMNRSQLIAALKDQGETLEKYKDTFKLQMITQKFMHTILRRTVTISPEEILRIYHSKFPDDAKNIRYNLKTLSIEVPNSLSASEKEARTALIASINDELTKHSSNFESIMDKYSSQYSNFIYSGNLLGKNKNELPSSLQKFLEETTPNSIIGPLSIGSSLFFFKFVSAHSDKMDTLMSKRKQEIEAQLMETKLKEALSDFINAEKNKMKINTRKLIFKS